MDMIDMLFGFCGGKKLYTGDLLNILQIKMAVGNYKKLLNKDKNESKNDNLLDKDSEDEYQSDEAIQDSQNAKLLDEESQAYQSGEICKQWKARRCCKKTYVIIVAVCCIILLAASVAISLGITHKCTPNITTNCSEPPVVSDSTVSRYGIYSFYSCNHGFYPNGESRIVCQDGDWSAVKFHCSKDCSEPPVVSDSTVNRSGIYSFYSCDHGYYPNGESTIICRDGAWSTVKFSCLKYCGSPPNIRNSIHQKRGNMSGAVTSYHCQSGYVAVGETNIVCNTNGQWSSSDLSCLKDCGRPPNKPSANTEYKTTYIGSKVIYYCDSGYSMVGRPVYTCQSDGTWTADNFNCQYIEPNSVRSDKQTTRKLAFKLVTCTILILLI